MRIAVYAGSFDPFTKGHCNLVKKGLKIFDKIIILVAKHPKKSALFTPDEKFELIYKTLNEEGVADIRIGIDILEEGLTVNYCKKVGAVAMIRSMRSSTEFEQEITMGHHNELQNPEIETIFLKPSQSLEIVSSTAVKDMISANGDISYMVSPSVEAALREKFKK